MKMYDEKTNEVNGWAVVVGLLVIVGAVLLIMSIKIIPDGFVGVKQTLGDYEDTELGTGIQFKYPLIASIKKVDVKRTTIVETVQVPSSEGLILI